MLDSALLRETARLEREYPMQKIEASQFEDLFDKQLHQYDSDRDMVSAEQKSQEQIEEQIREANKAFTMARKGDFSTKEREKALQDLETGYIKYKEIISNIEVGRRFYNDLAGLVGRFRENCKKFVHQRRIEAGQLETYVHFFPIRFPFGFGFPFSNITPPRDISNASAMASLNISQPSRDYHPQVPVPQHVSIPQQRQPSPKRTQQPTTIFPARQQQPPAASPFFSPAAAPPFPNLVSAQPQHQQEPLAAPQPTRISAVPPMQDIPSLLPTPPTPSGTGFTPGVPGGIWSPEMGIKFGSTTPLNLTSSGPGGGASDNNNARARNPPSAAPGPPMPGQWDPSRGLRFS